MLYDIVTIVTVFYSTYNKLHKKNTNIYVDSCSTLSIGVTYYDIYNLSS